jgi:hypothetical protein
MIMKKLISFGARTILQVFRAGHEVVAGFGAARLVRRADGRHELLGGTAADHAEAREWCSLFAPEVVFTAAPPPPARLTGAACATPPVTA